MPFDELSIVHQYVLNGWKVAPTGSRYICPSQFVSEHSDWDVMVLDDIGMRGSPIELDYSGLHVTTGQSGSDSFRAGALNMIHLEALQFQAWHEATEFAIQSIECWRSREKRVELFKKMEEVVIHRGLDSILDNRKAAPTQSVMAAAKRVRLGQLKQMLSMPTVLGFPKGCFWTCPTVLFGKV
jgi:hypothetical protein